MKREPIVWEIKFANDTPDRALIFKIYKELIQLNNRKRNSPIKKMGKGLE